MKEQLNFQGDGSDRLPPQNIEAEEAILGGIMLDPEAIGRVSDSLIPEAFYISAHKDIYQAALRLYSQSKPTDLLTVTSWLTDHDLLTRIGGRNKLATLVDRTVSAVNIDALAGLVMEKYLRRQLIKAFLTSPMELSRICGDGISESSNCCRNHPPPVSELLLGGIDNSPSKNSSEIEIPPSKDNPSKNSSEIEITPSIDNPSKKRRNWGEGNGTIHWRTITRGGKDYPQAYYHWQEKGRKKTKYIPKQILGDIQEAEFKKRPIREILTLLGVVPSPIKNTLLGDMENSPSKDVEQPEIPPSKNNPSNNSEQSEITPSKNSPSKTRRNKGLGSGFIKWKTITLHGKDYPQAWYHYEFWKDGDRLVKKCKYIPKRLLERIEKLEADKAPVREILSVLRVKF